MANQPQKKKPYNNWLVFLNIPFQMGIIILLGVLLGKWLDRVIFEEQKQVFIIICSLLAVFIALYNVIRQLKSMNK